MLRKFICEVIHYYGDNNERVKRDHIVYMPNSEYDTSGSRYKNHRCVENKLEEKLGKRYTDENPYSGRYYINSIRQEKL